MFVALCCCAAVRAQSLPVVADENNLWLVQVQHDPPQFSVLHRHAADSAHLLRPGPTFTGTLAKAGMAACDDRLWLVLRFDPHLVVKQIHWQRDPATGRVVYESSPRQSLPQGVVLRSLAATKDGPWALVQVVRSETLQRIDVPPADEADVDVDADIQTEQIPDEPPAKKPLERVREDRLLRLEGNRWVNAPLPDDWPNDARAWLVTARRGDVAPMLVAIEPNIARPSIWTATADDPLQWRRQIFAQGADRGIDLSTLNGSVIVPLAVDGQLLLAQQTTAQRLAPRVLLFRPERIVELGTLSMDVDPSRGWAVAGTGGQIVLLVADEAGSSWQWTSMNLLGQKTLSATPLVEQPSQPLADAAGYLVMVAVIAVAILIMFVFWHRGSQQEQLQLPAEFELADLLGRFFAAAIDMVGPVLVAAWLFELRPIALLNRWPWPGQALGEMWPGCVAIVLFVAYCTLSEMFTGATLGKLLLRLHVVDLNGQPPNVWQVLARNVLKVFDVVFYPLLILPMISPSRQRLGDLAAGTVVVVRRPSDADDGHHVDHDE